MRDSPRVPVSALFWTDRILTSHDLHFMIMRISTRANHSVALETGSSFVWSQIYLNSVIAILFVVILDCPGFLFNSDWIYLIDFLSGGKPSHTTMFAVGLPGYRYVNFDPKLLNAACFSNGTPIKYLWNQSTVTHRSIKGWHGAEIAPVHRSRILSGFYNLNACRENCAHNLLDKAAFSNHQVLS